MGQYNEPLEKKQEKTSVEIKSLLVGINFQRLP